MNILLFSDLHDSSRGLWAISDFLSKNKDITGLVFAGDLVNAGEPVSFAEKLISEISKFKLPLLWVPGNNDFGESYKVLQKYNPSLEGRIVELPENDGVSRPPNWRTRDDGRSVRRFTGIGGSPASWSSEYAGENSLSKEDIAGTIFVSHYPPPGVKYLNNQKATSHKLSPTSFKDAPIVHICGHLHHTQGIGYIGETKVIKLASAMNGNIAIMNLENLDVKFLRLL